MRLRKDMIGDYLLYITSMEFENPEDVTEDMSVYDDAIDSMAATARREGNLDKLQFAMDSLIADPEGRLEPFYGSGYPFSDGELVDILIYAFQLIWPEERISGPGEALPVEFVEN